MKKAFSFVLALALILAFSLVAATPVVGVPPLPEDVLDHFKCYWAVGDPVFEPVYLEDQFGAVNSTVIEALFFANPVDKVLPEFAPMVDPDHHLTFYYLDHEPKPENWCVEVYNQFGPQELTVSGDPIMLGVPTQKLEPVYHNPPANLDHFLVYEVIEGPTINLPALIYDWNFDVGEEVMVLEPAYLATPVRKTTGNGAVTEILYPYAHLVLYWMYSPVPTYYPVLLNNQMRDEQLLDVFADDCFLPLLAVPSDKVSFWPSGIPVAVDWDGDGTQELAIFQPISGTWYIDTSRDGTFNAAVDVTLGPFGQQPGDTPVAVDWDGDGRQELAIYRPTGGSLGSGTWYIDTSRNGKFNPVVDVMLGSFGQQPGDVPVAIDWDGDGRQELAIYRPTGGGLGSGTWYIDTSRNGKFNPVVDVMLGPFGQQPGDIPVAIDWDGGGTQELAIFRPTGGSLGPGTWYIDTSRNGKFNPVLDLMLGPFI